jgi:hypothetical protein
MESEMPQNTHTQELELQAPPAIGHASLKIGTEEWDLFVFGATRVGHDTFFQLTLLGPRACTVTVRARAVVHDTTARRILDAVCEWLLSGDLRDHVCLEVSEVSERST